MNHDERHRYEQAYAEKYADRVPIVPPCQCARHKAARRPLHQCCYCHRIFDPFAPSEGYLVDDYGRIRCRDCNTKN